MDDPIFEGEKNKLAPAVTITTVLLILTFVVGIVYRLFVTLG